MVALIYHPNFITVNRDEPNGGMVMTEDGETSINLCLGIGADNFIRFDSSGTSNSLYTYVVTDENNIILGVPGTDGVDFEGAGSGICRVWGLAYTGNITANLGDDAGAIALTDDCYNLSSNFVTVNREEVNGGTVSTENGETDITLCVGDGADDFVSFDSAGVIGANFAYVITDDNNIILALPGMDMANFDGAGGGICRVWGLAYTGNVLAQGG